MRLRLFPTLAAPSEARRGLAPLAAELGDGRFADLRTVVSELVAISVTHGATTPIDLSLTLGEGVRASKAAARRLPSRADRGIAGRRVGNERRADPDLVPHAHQRRARLAL